ncbi:FAD/NAD-binding domain-containing protein [Fomitiporia mediterranea MF3/22]|uniref:FAD/NAD-binding domain-containing protein n=1 Tax=Fomitiporia mediterranea (strain MF3/22) TaxID=694068 RepID=UPI0004408031|nr:FAD/NAD-binding domain-containing protein [Fomitiporia mediterranea MF3/22]EJD06063.1 FAD/NAD-binding domain-containing protein [Fomitiporia mediterranea MF3/22]
MNGHQKSLKVAVVGGGMTGLAVAIGLTRAGVDVDIYEAAPKLGEIGAGVGLGPNAIRVLRELEILSEIEAAVLPEKLKPRPFRFVFGLGEHEVIFDYPEDPKDDAIGIHRVTFLDALVHLVDASRIHCNKRCVAVRDLDSQRVQVLFADGTSTEADVVVGADGVRSAVRSYVVEGSTEDVTTNGEETNGNDITRSKLVRVAFTNNTAYRGLVPVEQLKAAGASESMVLELSRRLHCFVGDKKHVLTFPIKNGTVVNVVAFAADHSIPWGARPVPPDAWVTPRSTEELLSNYEGWGRDVRLLLGCIARPSVWSVHACNPPLESYVRGRVALVGDAAHAMLPYLGAGAGQGLEDALVIVRLLTQPQTNAGNIQEVLKAYDTVRRPHANMVLTRSTTMGYIYELLGPSGPSKEGIRSDLEEKWDDVWRHEATKDIEDAVEQLVKTGAFKA